MKEEIITQEKNLPNNAVTPSMLLQIAVEKGTDIDQLEKLMDLQERWERNEAKKAYVSAMAGFRAECPAISKTKVAHNSKHAGLAETIDQIKGLLSRHGLSHSWRTNQIEGVIAVTCCITHAMGHSESTTLQGNPDTSGSKNAIQSVGSTVSYLERYTLFAILGLASKDMDDDGGLPEKKPRITEQQTLEIDAKINENGIDMDKFLKWLKLSIKADSIAEIAVDALPAVMTQIEQSIKRHNKEKNENI